MASVLLLSQESSQPDYFFSFNLFEGLQAEELVIHGLHRVKRHVPLREPSLLIYFKLCLSGYRAGGILSGDQDPEHILEFFVICELPISAQPFEEKLHFQLVYPDDRIVFEQLAKTVLV